MVCFIEMCVKLLLFVWIYTNEFQSIVLLGWPKSPYGFFNKIKDTFFIFTNNFIDFGILSRSAVSHMV